MLDFQEKINLMYRHGFIMSGHEVTPEEKIHSPQKDEYSLSQKQDSVEFDKDLLHYRVELPWREGWVATVEVFENIDSFANAKTRLLEDSARKEGTFEQKKDTMDTLPK